jgi:hypothetical protein
MSIVYASWVHGNTAVVEFKEKLVAHDNHLCTIDDIPAYCGYINRGDGATFYGEFNTSNWFHFTIPTPVIIDNKRLKVAKIFLLYNCGYNNYETNPDGTRLKSIHLWDGQQRIKEFNNLNYSGFYNNSITSEYCWEITPPLSVYFGLNIATEVEFIGNYSKYHKIKFISAGADFIH